MRSALLLCLALPLSTAGLSAAEITTAPVRAAETTPRANATPTPVRASLANSRVSNRNLALNQPVRVDFTTLPRQIEGVDIASAVTNALAVGSAGDQWRLIGPVKVTEHEKTRTLLIAFALAPRRTGEFSLPAIPVTWLANEQVVEMGLVTVADRIAVGTEQRPLPKEIDGVAGFAWGIPLEEAAPRLGKTERVGDAVVAHPAQGLSLKFRGGMLCEATLDVASLTLDRARDSFLERWGAPQLDDTDATGETRSLTWILGWTSIVAQPATTGITLTLVREDLQERLARRQVAGSVFDVLEGPDVTPEPVAPEVESERRTSEAEQDFGKPTIPAPE